MKKNIIIAALVAPVILTVVIEITAPKAEVPQETPSDQIITQTISGSNVSSVAGFAIVERSTQSLLSTEYDRNGNSNDQEVIEIEFNDSLKDI